MLDRYDEYIEALLLAQYDVSEMIEHKLERGEIREDFIKHQVSLRYSGIKCCKGTISSVDGHQQSSQLDFIVPKRTAQHRGMGTHSLFEVGDALFVIEVKSNAKGSDFRDLNSTAVQIKDFDRNNHPMIGMFCYQYALTMKNLLKRFGYGYDNEIESFIQDESLTLQYPDIDFVLALKSSVDDDTNTGRSFFLRKDDSQLPECCFALQLDAPVTKYFFGLLARGIE